MSVICFDYDGVIADTFTLEETYYLDIYKKHGIYLFETGEDLRNACRGNFYEFCDEHGLDHGTLDRIFKEYNAFLAENHIEVPLFDGICDVLRTMMARHTVYVVSLNDADVIRERLAREGITDFEEIIGWQQATSKLETLRHLKARYGEDVYFISDSIGDMREAVEAEFPHILAVSYGWGEGDDLVANGAHVLFDTVSELSDYLDKI
ncbi:MAG: HAD hydrolase-like protein [Firmicutes bacterium]|nr:HAD hydrolase-like protein [Bacillota bacterium]